MKTHPSVGEGNTRGHLGVTQLSLVLLLLLFIPTAVSPQSYGRPYSLAAIPHAAAHVEASPPPVARQGIDEEERSARLIWTGTILIWIGAIGIYALGPARRVPFRR